MCHEPAAWVGRDLASPMAPDSSGRSFTMSKNAFDQILSAFRSGASDLPRRTGNTVAQVADSVSRVLDEAGSEGAKIRKALVRNWTSLRRPRRSRTVPILVGVLALGATTAYLLARAGPSEPRG
jgi:uncharacterized membrane protein YccC